MISKKKILVVEDNAINRSILTRILEDSYQVLEAENGMEALEVLRQYGEDVSLILLDIVMPVMDGYTFLTIIKADPAYASIPVIVSTQKDAESDEVEALSYGATDYIIKPYKPQVILHRIANIINLRETAAMINLFKYDRLTGLYSKEFFFQRVGEILLQNPDKKYDIICSDIESFKIINDAYGVQTADRLLCEIGNLYLQKVSDLGICCRMATDRFACLIEHKWEYADEMFSEALEEINELTEIKNIVMKWGIYPVNDLSATVEQMYDRALLAAQSIKGQYGTYFATYDDTLRRQILRRQKITDSMESALAEKQFEIYLQPKYRTKDGLLDGAEALVRWNHPEWGLQPPIEFIPLFEKNGFITKLDRYVWDMACEVLEKWDKAGAPPLPLSVNVSLSRRHRGNSAGYRPAPWPAAGAPSSGNHGKRLYGISPAAY